jgi:hypothetical protein
MSSKGWYTHWDPSIDLSGGGIELSYRRPEMLYLLVETDAVREVARVCEAINSPGVSPRCYLVGPRGHGKSTLLNYMAHILFQKFENLRALPVYCTMLGQKEDEETMESVFFQNLLTGLFDVPSDAAKLMPSPNHSHRFERLSVAESEYRMFLKEHGSLSLEFIYEAFENQVRHLRDQVNRVVFLVDGLDKYDPAVVLKFLRKSQERLNSLMTRYNCIFAYSADPTWLETLRADEFSGVRGHQITLRGWNTEEASELIRKRLEQFGVYVSLFDDKVVDLLVKNCDGNPRKILQHATYALHYAARQHADTIGTGLVGSILWSEDAKNSLFDRLTKDIEFRYGYEKLKTEVSDRKNMSILIAAHEGRDLVRSLGYKERAEKGITMEDDEFQRCLGSLLDRGCLRLGVRDRCLELEKDVKFVMDWVEEKGLSFDALPTVFDELRSRITSPPPRPKEEAFIKEQVRQAFERNNTRWLSPQEMVELILENPRTNRALEERFGSEVQAKLERLVPMMVGTLRKEGSLIYDASLRKDRCRGAILGHDLAKVVQHRDELELFEEARLDVMSSRFDAACDNCKKCMLRSLRRLSELLKREFQESRIDESFTLMRRLGIEIQKPVSLRHLMRTTIPKDGDSAKIILDTTDMYLKRLHEVVNQIEEDPDSYIRKVADPSYYTTLAELENGLRQCITTQLSKLSQSWWKERVPERVRTICEERKREGDLPYPWFSPKEYHPICYADFHDYVTIIKKRDNWEYAFKNVFKDVEMISSKLRELEPLRNKIAHSRDLQTDEIDILDLYTKQIMSAIAKADSSVMET